MTTVKTYSFVEIVEIIRETAGRFSVDPNLALAIASWESRFNPNAHNTKGEDSVGLFQLNRNKGLGTGYTVEQLKDPKLNAEIAIDHLSKTIKTNPSVHDPGRLAALSQRPFDPSTYAKNINIIFKALSGGDTTVPQEPGGPILAPPYGPITVKPEQPGSQEGGISLPPIQLIPETKIETPFGPVIFPKQEIGGDIVIRLIITVIAIIFLVYGFIRLTNIGTGTVVKIERQLKGV